MKLVKECLPWLSWQTGFLAILVFVGIVVCAGLPIWSMLVGSTPLLLIAACLLPCLLPFVFSRKKATAALDARQE